MKRPLLQTITSRSDHELALRRIGTLMEQNPSPDSEEGREFETLAQLVGQYEDRIYGTNDMEISDADFLRCLAEEQEAQQNP